jgi:hypothetical protein
MGNSFTIRTMKLNPTKIIHVAGVITFLGYALMHFTFRSFNIWKIYPGNSIKLIFRIFDIPMDSIYTNGQPTLIFLLFLNITGLILLSTALLSVYHITQSRTIAPWWNTLYFLSGIIIIAHAFASYVQSKLHYNVPIEYITRMALPFLCWALAIHKNNFHQTEKTVRRSLPFIIGLTFFAHGIYAINFLPIPQDFMLMTSNILKTPREISLQFLFVIGIIDLVLLIGIFVPFIRKGFVIYAIIWGFLTTSARLIGHYDPTAILNFLNVWIPETLVRSGHFLLPLAYWFYLIQYPSTKKMMP